MSKDGFIIMMRKLVDWEWYHDSHMVHLFIHCILRANYEESNFQGHKVLRGQFVGGLKTLSFDTGISQQTLRTCLNRLKSTGEITINSTNRFSIITVCKYDSYQTRKYRTNKQINTQLTLQLTNDQQATNIQSTTSNNTNKETKKQVKESVKEKTSPHSLKNNNSISKPGNDIEPKEKTSPILEPPPNLILEDEWVMKKITLEQVEIEFKNADEWKNFMLREFRHEYPNMTKDYLESTIKSYLRQFPALNEFKKYKTVNDAKGHFYYSLKLNLSKIKNKKTNGTTIVGENGEPLREADIDFSQAGKI